MEIALLGGSFNPPHVGHLLAAVYTHATQGIDEVWLMPSFRHPFGKPLAPFEHRARMCELLAAQVSGWMKVTRIEQELGGEGRTVDTLEALLPRHAEHRFTLVIGSDILKDLPQWKDVEKIRKLVRFLVLHRAGYPSPEAVGPPLVEVSSTKIREAFDRGQQPSALVPDAVLQYAREHKLYYPAQPG